MDATEIQKACMADLGRQRQDELPLSGREGKRPSYELSRGNGTGHYAPSLKKGLESKWKVQIQDEESAELQGLAVGDSRPWAKITETYMSRNHADTAPPLIQRKPLGRIAVQLLPSPQQLRGINKRQSEIKVETIPPKRPATKPSGSIGTKPQSTTRKQANKVSASAPTKTSLPIGSKPLASEHIVYNELCKWLDPESKKPLFVVTLSLRIQKNSDKGFLVLSALNKEDKSHNVLEISAPDVQGDCYWLYPNEMASRSRYLLQFPTASDAKKFGMYFESLQKAAARMLGAPSKPGTPPSTAEIPSIFKLPPSYAGATSTPKASDPDKTSDPEKWGGGEAKLVDVESPSMSSEQEETLPTIEDAAESLFDLIEKILPKAAAFGLNVTDDAISDIQESAIDSWLRRGFLGSETDDMKSELLELLRILVRIKRKAESRKTATQPELPFVIQSLKDFGGADSDAKHIRYTVSEIQSLSSDRAPAPARLNKSLVTPRRTQTTGRSWPAAAVAGMSEDKARLDSTSALERPDATDATPSTSNGEQKCVADEVCPVAPKSANRGDISSPQSAPAVKGLGTSR
ncbi:hypothetical protein E4U21_001752 [Claviceps maximensis]|nr:hypothetical protein E4U21_001752 [Claviceps maximensis]